MADSSPYIGTIDGIKIQLHWSFIALLIIISFTSLYYFFLWVLLFVCVLIHELTHSVTSKRNGINVRKIVLYPFGGGSIIDFEKVTPDIEFRISIVGPISSLLLASLFGIAAIYTPVGIIRYTAQNLFTLNLLLGLFNLLPWLPLDGGRALRSYLQRSRSAYEATKIAAKVSNVVTVMFVGGTLVYAAFAQSYSLSYREFLVLWDVLIAVFIYDGAKAELQSSYLKENTKSLKVADAVSSNYLAVSRNTPISGIYAAVMKHHKHIIVFRDGAAVKILSNVSLQKAIHAGGDGSRTIAEFGEAIPTIEYNAALYTALERMQSEGTGAVAVMKESRIVGLVSAGHAESVIALYLSHKGKLR